MITLAEYIVLVNLVASCLSGVFSGLDQAVFIQEPRITLLTLLVGLVIAEEVWNLIVEFSE